MRRATPRWSFRTVLRAFVPLAAWVASAPAGDETQPPPAPDDAQAPAIRREIRVRIACDEEWRSGLDWADTARSQLRQASSLFEHDFGIRWKAVDVVPWTSDDGAGSLGVLLGNLQREVSCSDADVVLGFVGQSRGIGADRDYSLVGQARLYGPVAIFRRRPFTTSRAWIAAALAHELGHLLGAWHCEDTASIMFRGGDRTSYCAFDAQSAAAIEVARDLDFARGADWLDATRRDRIREIYRSGHAPGELVPYASTEMDRALAMSRSGRMRDARDEYRRALADQEACVGPDDFSLTHCLRGAAWAELHCRGLDRESELERAELSAQRGHDIAVAAHRPEDPPLACDMLLADIEWERGRRDLAESHYRQIYEERLKTLGATDPDTVAIKEALDRRTGAPLPMPGTDITWDLATTASSDRAFDDPGPDSLHLRRAQGVGAARDLDSSFLRFEVAAPRPGRLTLSLRQGGPTPEPPCIVSTHVAGGFDAERPTTVEFAFARLRRIASGPKLRYACSLGVTSAQGDETRFACEVPIDRCVVLRRELRLAGTAFARLPASGSQLFARQWVAASDGIATRIQRGPAGELVAVDGVAVSPDGTGAKQFWSLELSFVPDPAK